MVRFIEADSLGKILEAYQQLAKEFTIYVIDEKEENIIRLVHERIANLNSAILFIFDNVEEYTDIEPYLNSIMNILNDKAQVIITTKNNKLSEDIENIILEPFSKEEAILYLKKSLKNRLNEKDIYKLIEEFGSKDVVSPYRLSKAVAYLKENKLLKVNDYINYFKNSKDDHIETVLLLQLLEKSPLAWQMLQYSAHLDPDFISIEIFKELFLIDEEKLQEPIKRLEALSLMNLINQNGQAGLQLHRLVQTITKQYINKYKEHAIDEKEIYIRLVEVLDNLFPYLTAVPNEDWENAKLLYPHIIKILSDDNIKIDELRKANLYQKLGFYNEYILCKFEESLKYHKEALRINQELYQSNHPYIACSLNNIGLAYNKLGSESKGLKYHEKALGIFQELYQGNNQNIANTLNNIGITYDRLGNNDKALKYHKEALKMFQELHQGNHSDIAKSLGNVGLAYRNLGYIPKGLEYLEEALKMLEELHQDNHPDIATSLNNVGATYDKLGETSKGLEYLKKALKMFQILHHENHPSTINSLNNIGVAYINLNNISKGLKYFKLVLKLSQELYQDNHPAIADSLNNIGWTYQCLGCIYKGLKYYEVSLKIYKALYPNNHSNIANSFSNIGFAYYKLGDINKAIEYYKQSYLIYVQTLGLEHPNTKFIRSYLKTVTPEFIKNNETREFILQRGDFEEITLEIKLKLQEKVLNKIFINAVKGKWNKFSILGDWGVKSYLSDKYLVKQLGALSSLKNIEIAKMLCFEAICLIAINSPNKNFACVKEFARAYPELTNKITNEHPEYFIDGSILRACINDEAILRKLLGSG